VNAIAREGAYTFISEALTRFGYARLSKAEKGLIRAYLCKVSGLSRAQVARLISGHLKGGAPAGSPRSSGADLYTALHACGRTPIGRGRYPIRANLRVKGLNNM